MRRADQRYPFPHSGVAHWRRLSKIREGPGRWHRQPDGAVRSQNKQGINTLQFSFYCVIFMQCSFAHNCTDLLQESWGTKFSAPRRRRAGNAYVMTSPVERVEVLVGVLILLSITYGKVSTVEVVEYMFVQSGERARQENGE
jgi:hypothetical protein